MKVNCSNRGIVELDLNVVFATEEERNALAVVKHLDLSRNELRIINNLQPFSCLATLDLSFNKIQQLSGLPLGIVRLNVSHNELTTLEGLVTLPFLQDIDASHNRLHSLSGLPRTSPVNTLKLSHNRLSNLSGIESVSATLQALEVDSNYLCVVEDLRPLSRMRNLQQLSVRDNPMVDAPNYRNAICGIVAHLLVLDGTPVSAGSSQINTGERAMSPVRNHVPQSHSTTTFGNNDSSHLGAGGNHTASAIHRDPAAAAPASNNASNGPGSHKYRTLSYEGIRQRNEGKKTEVIEDNKRLQLELDDLQRQIERERQDSDKAQRKVRSMELELREARRVLAEELNKLTTVRQENEQLRQEVEAHKQRAEKLARDYKYCRDKVKGERQRRLEDLEKAKVSHQAVVHSLRSRLQEYAEDGRSVSDAERGLREEVHRLQDYIIDLEKQNKEMSVALSTQSNAAVTSSHYSPQEEYNTQHQHPANVMDMSGPIFPQQLRGHHAQQARPVMRSPPRRQYYDIDVQPPVGTVSVPMPQHSKRREVGGQQHQPNHVPVNQHHHTPSSSVPSPQQQQHPQGSGGGVVDIASQLKEWLVAELQERQGQNPPDTYGRDYRDDEGNGGGFYVSNSSAAPPPQAPPPPQSSNRPQIHQHNGLSSPARSVSTSGILDEVWARNESILGSVKVKRT